MSKKLLKDVSINSFVGFLTLVISFLFNIQIARILSIDDYGGFELKLSQAIILSLIMIFGTDQYAVRLFKNNNSVNETNNKIITFKFILFFLILVSLFIFNKPLILPFIAVGIQAFNISYIYEIKERLIVYTNIVLIEKFLYILLCIIYFITYDRIDARVLFYSLLISNAISIILQVYKSNFEYRIRFTLPKINDLLPCLFIFLISFIDYINSGVTKTLISERLSLSEVAIYSVALKLVILGTVFQSQVDKIFRKNLILESVKKNIKAYFYFSSIPIMLLGVTVYLGFPYYVGLFPSEYFELNRYAILIALYFPIINLRSLANIFMIKMDKTNVNFILTFIFGGLKILLFYLIMPSSGFSFLMTILMTEIILIICKFIYIRTFTLNNNI